MTVSAKLPSVFHKPLDVRDRAISISEAISTISPRNWPSHRIKTLNDLASNLSTYNRHRLMKNELINWLIANSKTIIVPTPIRAQALPRLDQKQNRIKRTSLAILHEEHFRKIEREKDKRPLHYPF